MATGKVSLACDVFRNSPDPIRTAPGPTRTDPLLALMRSMISSAFKDAKRCKHGEPTDTAMQALEWLMEEPENKWVTPPGTFAWCCSWLGFRPETIRECGLPPVSFVFLVGGDDTKGLPEVFRVWAEHRAAFLRAGRHDVVTEAQEARTTARRRGKPGRNSIVPRCAAPRVLPPGRDYQGYSQFCSYMNLRPASELLWRCLSR